MNWRSVVSSPAHSDILAIGVGVGGILLARFLRSAFPAPSGTAWLWGCVAIALLFACGMAVRHGFRGLPWMLRLMGAYIVLQSIVQIGFSHGVIFS